jgi:phosphoribosylformylglycinamidine synthase
MGAAGIICSNSEMSAKGEHGMVIYLDKVPTRQAHMKPYEILLSESQERMLIVVEKGKEKEVEAVFEKWDLNCAIIGEVTDTKRLHYYMDGVLVADVPADDLVLGGGAPVYHREYKEPAYFSENKKFTIDSIKEPADLKAVALFLVNHPNIASKRWVINQYDSMVGTANMSTNAPSDSAVVNIKGTDKAINLTVDCNARYVYSDPEVGCAIAVAEAARNITCTGGEPVAITNCLNFGNPYNPEVYWQFVSAIKGMSVACTKFETPVTGGNVSFYNQSSDEGPVFPTPTIGMLGVMDSKEFRTTLDFKHVGDSIFLIGESKNDICSSEYLTSFHGVKSSPAPFFDLDKEYDTHQVIKGLIHNKLIQSAHDVSDGGLFVTLLESAMPNHFGFTIESDDSVRKDAFLFGEAQGRIVVSVAKEQHESFIEYMSLNEIEYNNLGEVTSSEIKVDDESFENIDTYTYRYEHALEEIIEKQ